MGDMGQAMSFLHCPSPPGRSWGEGGLEEMAQPVKFLLYKDKELSHSFQNPHKQAKHVCDPSTGEVEIGRSLELLT